MLNAIVLVLLLLIGPLFLFGQESKDTSESVNKIAIGTIPVKSIKLIFWDLGCNKPVPGVVVSPLGSHKMKKQRSDSNGEVTISDVWPGNYELLADKYSFKKTVIDIVGTGSTFSFVHTIDLERGYASDDLTPTLKSYDPCKFIDKPLEKFMHVG